MPWIRCHVLNRSVEKLMACECPKCRAQNRLASVHSSLILSPFYCPRQANDVRPCVLPYMRKRACIRENRWCQQLRLNRESCMVATNTVGWTALMAVALVPGTLAKLVDTMYAPPPITVSRPELPPLVYDPTWASPGKPPAKGFWNGHWVGFLFLPPFIVMLVVHEFLGMSWAFLGGDTPRDNDSRGFNLMMFGAHFLGGLAFMIYAFALPIVKGRGWHWVMPKLMILAIYWGAGLLVEFSLEILRP